MKEVGLIPSNTGKPGGKETGQKMTHYTEEGGCYERAFMRMPKKHILPFTSLDGQAMKQLIEGSGSGRKGKNDQRKERLRKLRPISKNKTKYSCCGCSANVWGKPDLRIICGTCNQEFHQ